MSARAEQAASVLLAVAIGVALALALVHWIDLEGVTSGTGGAAALAAAPGGPLRRAWRWWCHHLQLHSDRTRLRWIEEEITWMREEIGILPMRLDLYSREAERLRVAIAVAEQGLPLQGDAHERC